jgi:hypothetical protein
MRKNVFFKASLTFILCAVVHSARAQLRLMGQLRTRTEYRNGVGTPRPLANDAAIFTSQRTRLTFQYPTSRLIFQASIQDVRVWGQDASTISHTDGGRLGLHEGWGELILFNKKDTSFKAGTLDYLSLKLGRQELVYDDSRLLGNLDWLQQARRHDAAVLKMTKNAWQADIGAAFNQHTDAFNYNGTYYTPANVMPYVKDSKGNLTPTPAGLIPLVMASGISAKTGLPFLQIAPSTNGLNQDYKAMQFINLAHTTKSVKISALFFADQFGKYVFDSVRNIAGTDTGFVFGRRFNQQGVNTRFTTGLLASGALNKAKTWLFTAGAYYQGGHDRDGLRMKAFTTTASLAYVMSKFSVTAGWDYLSGNDAFSTSPVNNRFDPLYGTPHKFWGFMDYFYAGTGAPSGGLSNPFLKTKYTSQNKRFAAGLDIHYFSLANDQKDAAGQAISKHLGNEFDLVTSYALNKISVLEWGFSLMDAKSSMAYAKGVTPGSTKGINTWSYLMISIKPEYLFK